MDFSNLLQKTRQQAFSTGIKMALIAVSSEIEDRNHSDETLETLKSVLNRIQNARLDP